MAPCTQGSPVLPGCSWIRLAAGTGLRYNNQRAVRPDLGVFLICISMGGWVKVWPLGVKLAGLVARRARHWANSGKHGAAMSAPADVLTGDAVVGPCPPLRELRRWRRSRHDGQTGKGRPDQDRRKTERSPGFYRAVSSLAHGADPGPSVAVLATGQGHGESPSRVHWYGRSWQHAGSDTTGGARNNHPK